ncbi:MAG: lysozyme inhibitor LprI family protein [Eubacteriales bacterium]|nr:lysozyme inhibitor LprI family protein [Eubacteriales bacterium]
MYCPHCGNKLPDDAQFCNCCGNSVIETHPGQPEGRETEPKESGGNAIKIVLILVIAVIAIAILVAGSMLMKDHVETQRAARDAQQALEAAEEEQAKYGDQTAEEDDNAAGEEDDSEPEDPDDDDDADDDEDGEAIVEEPAEKSQAYTDFASRLEALQSEFTSGDAGADNATMTANADDLYQRSDALLNDIYQYVKANTDSSTFASIQQEERNWIAQRDAKAETDASDWVGGSGYNLIYLSSRTESTLDRCEALLNYID